MATLLTLLVPGFVYYGDKIDMKKHLHMLDKMGY